MTAQQALTFEFATTGYGEIAKQGKFRVAQTGGKIAGVAGRAVAALEAGDWESFSKLYKRSGKLRLTMGRGDFGGTLTEVAVCLSYGSALLGAIRLPSEAWIGMGIGQALSLTGLSV